ncbi:MAG: hypothetical protein ABI877_22320, partial [Gemmatimonadaceae bacterium]
MTTLWKWTAIRWRIISALIAFTTATLTLGVVASFREFTGSDARAGIGRIVQALCDRASDMYECRRTLDPHGIIGIGRRFNDSKDVPLNGARIATSRSVVIRATSKALTLEFTTTFALPDTLAFGSNTPPSIPEVQNDIVKGTAGRLYFGEFLLDGSPVAIRNIEPRIHPGDSTWSVQGVVGPLSLDSLAEAHRDITLLLDFYDAENIALAGSAELTVHTNNVRAIVLNAEPVEQSDSLIRVRRFNDDLGGLIVGLSGIHGTEGDEQPKTKSTVRRSLSLAYRPILDPAMLALVLVLPFVWILVLVKRSDLGTLSSDENAAMARLIVLLYAGLAVARVVLDVSWPVSRWMSAIGIPNLDSGQLASAAGALTLGFASFAWPTLVRQWERKGASGVAALAEYRSPAQWVTAVLFVLSVVPVVGVMVTSDVDGVRPHFSVETGRGIVTTTALFISLWASSIWLCLTLRWQGSRLWFPLGLALFSVAVLYVDQATVGTPLHMLVLAALS